MPKHIYIIIAGILAFGYLPNIIPRLNDVLTVLSLLWCFFGLFYYSKVKPNLLNSRKNHRYTYWILFLILLSCISPLFIYNQSLLGTFIALRTIPLILYLNVFLMMQPSEDDLYKAFKFLGLLSVVVTLYATYYNPFIFGDPEKMGYKVNAMTQGLNQDIFVSNIGQHAAVFLYFLAVNKILKKNPSKMDLLYFIISITYLLLGQNRSVLIIAVPLAGVVILKMRSKYKYLLIGAVFIASILLLAPMVEGLIQESQDQLGDSDYARWKALDYLVLNWPYNIYTFLFGNGVPCVGSSFLKIIHDAADNDIYASDIGLFGTFYHYGFILFALLYTFVIRGLKRYNPLYLRFFALWFILVPTIHHFGLFFIATQLKFSIFIYLVLYYQSLHKLNKHKEIKE